jgi:hypothetical protein
MTYLLRFDGQQVLNDAAHAVFETQNIRKNPVQGAPIIVRCRHDERQVMFNPAVLSVQCDASTTSSRRKSIPHFPPDVAQTNVREKVKRPDV